MNFKIMRYAQFGTQEKLAWLLQKVEELIPISHTLIKNKQEDSKS